MASPQVLSDSISASVGASVTARNVPADVKLIQQLLNSIAPASATPLVVDGKSGPLLVQRITEYQKNRLDVVKPDGVIDPGGKTFKSLFEDARKAVIPPAGVQAPSQGESGKQQLVTQATCDGNVTLSDADFKNAALLLGNGIEVNILKAFAVVESGGRSGFGPALMPVAAYEGHIFRKYTKQEYDKAYPLLSYAYLQKAGPQWRANNKDQATTWKTLLAAFNLDPEAALMAVSYGMFQIMGFNFAACGFKDVFAFVAAMKLNAGAQLMAFVNFCKKNPALIKAMKNKDYAAMARNYNGADYGNYDVLIKKAYENFQGKK